jgi:putative ABC transport system permease protein
MTPFFPAWIWPLAWRDGRRGLFKLLLALSCVMVGVASMVAAMSFRENLAASTREQAKTLLGADLAIQSREPFSPEAEALIKSIGGDQSREIAFSSMAYFPGSGASRLVQVRAVFGNFPYYGQLETEPAAASEQFQSGHRALVDQTLMLQFNIPVGATLRIGDQDFRIIGKLRKIPGESPAFSLISPRVYLPLNFLDRTQLLQKGSLARYRVLFKLDSRVDVDRLVQTIAPQLEQLRLRADTVKQRAAAISRAMENLSRYLGLSVFIAALLAGVGIASGVHVYIKEKTASVALLRCVGATPLETVGVYLIQILAIGVAGSCVGAALGVGLQTLLPLVLKDFLPVTATVSLAPKAVFTGIGVGLGTGMLFALLPLVSVRNVSPLLALRSSYEKTPAGRDPWLWLIACVVVCGIVLFAMTLTDRWIHAVWFTAGVVIAFTVIALVARGTSAMVKRFAAPFLPFAWRQGLANVHRPNNQTTALMLALGLGAFLLVTLYNVQSTLLNEVAKRGGKNEPNLVLFDVQPDQRDAVRGLIRSFKVPLLEEVPVVTMRLAAIKNQTVKQLRDDSRQSIPRWALRREYRVTYRSGLSSSDRIISGTWTPRVRSEAALIPISLEKTIAATLRVGVGDRLEFELQGVPLFTQVASIREVDWQRLQPNFFVIFPEGVLEQAPQFYALVSRTDSPRTSALLQRAVVERFPNVSMIDLTLVLNTLDAILGRISAAIRFLAFFTILAGLFVLGSAILSRRSQRLKESILLKMLGAPRRQIVTMVAAEYLFLAALASLTGAFLSALASWAAARYFFGIPFSFSPLPVVTILVVTTGTTVALGVAGCRGIFRRSALEALRAET